jgi:hypothetical protein
LPKNWGALIQVRTGQRSAEVMQVLRDHGLSATQPFMGKTRPAVFRDRRR